MTTEFIFYDYVGEDGTNCIRRWLECIGKRPKAKLNERLLYLRAIPPGQWRRPWVDTLQGEAHGRLEIRAEVGKVQYRLIGCHGPGQRAVTLLMGARERNNRIEPLSALDSAQARRMRVERSPATFRRPHDYA